jgi:D-glycero-alpha-D-manno-heptose 1-phosphate guanylyltransferase
LGTAGAVKKAMGLIPEERFLVMNGDTFFDVPFGRLAQVHEEKRAIATMALAGVADVDRYGKVELDADGQVTDFCEKNNCGAGLVNSGICLFERRIAGYIPEGNVSLERDILPRLVHKGLYGLALNGYFVDIGLPEDYLALNQEPKKIMPHCTI